MTSVTGFRAFSAENRPKNMPIIGWLKAYAEKKGATRSQVALAWLLAKGPHVVPIPGSRNEAHLLETLGAVNVQFSAGYMQEIATSLSRFTVHGERIGKDHMASIDYTD